jgi:hypothetical protein
MRWVEDAIEISSSDLTRTYSCKTYGASQIPGEFPRAQDMKYHTQDFGYLPGRLIYTT